MKSELSIDFGKIYDIAWHELLEIAKRSNLEEEDLKIYFKPNHILEAYKEWKLDFDGKDDMRFFMCKLAESLQNSGQMGNIKFDQEHMGLFNEGLRGFDPKQIIEYYKGSWEKMLDFFKGRKDKDGKVIVGKRKDGDDSHNWIKYCKGIITGAEYLSHFDSGIEFRGNVESKQNEIIYEIEKVVFGMGFALASDFIKEIGYTEYGKPDVHIKDVYKTVFAKETVTDEVAMEFLRNIAKASGEDVYTVDKVLWLVCAKPGHRFYMHNVSETNKEILMEKYRKDSITKPQL